mmetsp:Transcript_24527/g.62101  ORF Transcript_24527/g.62101 Transcript_24527/m.62101 type:complete len:200 (+) Transcript_24527:423-1022(+)
MVMCMRGCVLAKARSACREMPALAASEMMATRFSPRMKAERSCKFTWSSGTFGFARLSVRAVPSGSNSNLRFRPVISATRSGPKCETTMSSAVGGMGSASSSATNASRRAASEPSPSPPVGRCFSSSCRRISAGALTASISVSPLPPSPPARASASAMRAAPVLISPSTTEKPFASASSVWRSTCVALSELSSCRKNCW